MSRDTRRIREGLATLAMAVALTLSAGQAKAAGITTLASFSGPNGAEPYAGLTDVGGTLYGATESGGTGGDGTLFSWSASNSLSTLVSFNGGGPVARLTDVGGTLYGTAGGGLGYGTIFSYSPGNGLQTLANFDYTNGSSPRSALIDVNGTLYGTTGAGGSGANSDGTLFSWSPNGGGLTTLASFDYYSNGVNPFAGLTDVGGTLYGTTSGGGAGGAMAPSFPMPAEPSRHW